MSTRVDQYAETIPQTTAQNVQNASAAKTASRTTALAGLFRDPGQAQDYAAATKSYVLDNLGSLLRQFEEKCIQNGIHVHWAEDAAEARQIVLDICKSAAPTGSPIVKAKSMATEEIHLNHALEDAGYHPIETDLGEFVVQIDNDVPTHIVTPIIHKNRNEISKSFVREHLGSETTVPEELAGQARQYLRSKFREAPIGISGVNFGIAETGRLVLVENEGNSRLSTTATDTHIAVMGLEKLLPTEADLAVFLPLLAGSATGQRITTYTHFISGPRKEDEADGPQSVHAVILDNGRSKIMAGPYRDILRCIRCGACLNVCPVYRRVGGHGYKHVYSGPLGAVLAPGLEGVEAYGDLAKASSLCGACEEVCPVRIPIPRMLLQLRDESVRKKVVKDAVPWSLYSIGTRSSFLWRTGLTMLPMASYAPHPLKSQWTSSRDLPEPNEESFRRWWHGRES
ncbi:MAG: iron-sulfur cluster-binding protein [Armatimonadetes bacterium]|nr:iron-sulfur cluster-binding protein [Armatimonadota bacterium]